MNKPKVSHPATFLDILKRRMEEHAQKLAAIYNMNCTPNLESEIVWQSVDYTEQSIGIVHDTRDMDATITHLSAQIKNVSSSRTVRNVFVIACMLALFQRAVGYAEHAASTRSADAVVARRLNLMRQRTVVNVIQSALRKANLRIDFPAMWETRSREITQAAHLLFNVNVISVWAADQGKQTQVMGVFSVAEVAHMMASK